MEVRDIRRGEETEAEQVTRLAYLEFVPPDDEDWNDYLGEIEDVPGRAGKVPVVVAVDGGRVIGSATLETEEAGLGDDPIEPGTLNLRMLGVDPESRGHGAGRALVDETVRRARAAGKRAVTLHTILEMQVAQRLYESMGFVRDPARDWQVTEEFRLYAFRLDL